MSSLPGIPRLVVRPLPPVLLPTACDTPRRCVASLPCGSVAVRQSADTPPLLSTTSSAKRLLALPCLPGLSRPTLACPSGEPFAPRSPLPLRVAPFSGSTCIVTVLSAISPSFVPLPPPASTGGPGPPTTMFVPTVVSTSGPRPGVATLPSRSTVSTPVRPFASPLPRVSTTFPSSGSFPRWSPSRSAASIRGRHRPPVSPPTVSVTRRGSTLSVIQADVS